MTFALIILLVVGVALFLWQQRGRHLRIKALEERFKRAEEFEQLMRDSMANHYRFAREINAAFGRKVVDIDEIYQRIDSIRSLRK